MGVPPNRIDLVTSIDGVRFDEAWRDRLSTTYGDQAGPNVIKRLFRKPKADVVARLRDGVWEALRSTPGIRLLDEEGTA